HDEALVTGPCEVGRRGNCSAAHQRRDGGESRDRGGKCERTFGKAASHQLSFLARMPGDSHLCSGAVRRKRFRNCYQVETGESSGLLRISEVGAQTDYRNGPENASMVGIMAEPAQRRIHPGSRVTIREVAEQAGVSIATVSRVLNDREDVSPETRDLVGRVIR